MTIPTTRDGLREMLERALEASSASEDYEDTIRDAADAILTALDGAGIAVVPKEPTEAMIREWEAACPPPGRYVSEDAETAAYARADWTAMLDASPFAHKEKSRD